MKKTVSSGKRMTTVNLDGTECEVVFSSSYNVFSVKSENEVTMALESGKVKGDDGVITIPAGESRMYPHMRGLRSIFITGSGKVEVFASNEAVNPFKSAPVNSGGVTSSGDNIQMDNLQGGVPFSEMVVSGDNIIGQDLTVSVSGKNLTPYPYVHTTKTVNGITFTDNGDGTITANGTATAMVNFTLIWKNYHLAKGTYTISGCPEGGNVNTGFFIVCGTNSIRFATDTGNGDTFAIDDDTNDFTFSLRINSGVTVNNLVFRPQLEIGSTATEYEPYHGSVTTITPDSNPYTIPNDIRQVDGLNNITVSEGEISVTGVKRNVAIKRIWDEIDEIKTAIIVSNGETE